MSARTRRSTVTRALQSFGGRLVRSLPALGLVLLLDFALLHLPGTTIRLDPAATGRFSAEQLEEHVAVTRERFGLDRPLPERFGDWCGDALTLDFGLAMTEPRPVRALIAEGLGATVILQAAALLVMFLPGVAFGVWLALRRRRPDEPLLRGALYALQAIPEFWLATLLLVFLATKAGWELFPLEGRAPDGTGFFGQLAHLVLPALALGLPGMAIVARQTRNAMIDALEGAELRALRARGISERRLISVYALRQALVPVVLLFGASLPALVGGSIVVERIFNVPGLGQLLWTATFDRDYPVLQALLLASALAVVIGWALADALVALLDPRVSS